MYSDFKQQHAHNPDGYASNITAWVTGLAHAMKAGVVPGGPDFLSLRTGEALLRALETKEWGKPLALDAVIVGRGIQLNSFASCAQCLTAIPLGRSCYTGVDDSIINLSYEASQLWAPYLGSPAMVDHLMDDQTIWLHRQDIRNTFISNRTICSVGECEGMSRLNDKKKHLRLTLATGGRRSRHRND